MRKVIIALVLAAIVSIAFITPALADEGGQYNENALWGQMHKLANQIVPGMVPDTMSNDHTGWKSVDPPPYPGGIQDYYPTPP
jgi:hypothetical protein